VSLFELAESFLLGLNDRAEAAPFLAAYDMRIQFDVTDGEPFYAVLSAGRLEGVHRGRVERFGNRDDVELFGREEGFRLIFELQATPATAMYYGKVTPRGERAKHCQVAVVYRLLRLGQEPAWKTEL
jgi:hypothetical protein